MSEKKKGRKGMLFIEVLFMWWFIAQARNGTERQMQILQDTGEVVTWEYAQGCFSDDNSIVRKIGRGCWALFLSRASIIQNRQRVTGNSE